VPAPPESLDPAVTSTLLAVVSDKTGYPVDTLELDMDMEADLGIDSIKRVEILGALQQHFPHLPTVQPADLVELRTLRQITAHLSQAALTAVMPAPLPPAVPAPAVEPAVPTLIEAGVPRGVVQLRMLPPPDYLEYAPPAGYCCLLTDDGTLATVMTARALVAEGWPVVVLGFPGLADPQRPALPAGVAPVVLQNWDEAHLAQVLKTIAVTHGPVGTFIHLDPPPRPHAPNGNGGTSVAQAVLRQVFLIARHLGPALTAAARHGRSAFLAVAHLDGQLGLGVAPDSGVLGGGLFGLTKTLNAEWPSVFCRALDISPGFRPDQVAAGVLAELHDPDLRLVEVGYNERGRVTLDVEPAMLEGRRA
jgi:acyl carrier protein